MSPGRPSLRRILSDASLIISAHSGHFLALSILFIFPASFASSIYHLLSNPSPLQTLYLRFLTIFSTAEYEITDVGIPQFLYQLNLNLISIFFGICAASSITASTFNGFYGRPIGFIPTLRSVRASFLPLLATTLLIEIIILLIAIAFIVLVMLACNGLASIGFDMDYYKNEYLLVFFIAFSVVMVALMIYLQIQWSLCDAVVVVESNWGFSALRRSAYLVKGARSVMFSFLMFFGFCTSVLAIFYLKFVSIAVGGSDGWNCWLIVKIIGFAGFLTILLLYSLAGTTVFFIHCKALRLEFEFEIDGKLGGEYLPLPYGVDVV